MSLKYDGYQNKDVILLGQQKLRLHIHVKDTGRSFLSLFLSLSLSLKPVMAPNTQKKVVCNTGQLNVV